MVNGRRKRPLFKGLESPTIAHNELVARANSAPWRSRGCDFLENRTPLRRRFTFRSEDKSSPAQRSLEQRQAVVAPEHAVAQEEGRDTKRAARCGFVDQRLVPRSRLGRI